MRRSLVIAVSILAVIAAGYGLWDWTRSVGRDALEDFALEGQKCTKPSCDAERELMTKIGMELTNMSAARLEWCFGVNSWAETRVSHRAWLKSIAVDIMYLPCGPIAHMAQQTPPPAAP
jgi:hypothetical protein